jgi:hypothetical protein
VSINGVRMQAALSALAASLNARHGKVYEPRLLKVHAVRNGVRVALYTLVVMGRN